MYSNSVGADVTSVVLGPAVMLIGQGVVRNVRINGVYVRQPPPMEPALQDKHYRRQELIGKIVGWWFTVCGAVFFVGGIALLVGVIARAA